MKSIDKCVSNKISNLNLFLSAFIVALHSSCREQLIYGGGVWSQLSFTKFDKNNCR